MENLIFQKAVDMSMLQQGLSIPTIFQQQFYKGIGFQLLHGEQHAIKILLGGIEYDALLKNQPFSLSEHQGHPDVLQIRYSPNSPIAIEMRSVFYTTNEMVLKFQQNRLDKKKQLLIPEDKKEYVNIMATPVSGTVMFDCVISSDYQSEIADVRGMNEYEFENEVSRIDENAGIYTTQKIVKIRKMTRAIGDSLKAVYGYRCQICGEYIGERYDSNVIQAHHIDYFTHSMNNDSSNIMIVCPNHHAIIHDRNPIFYRDQKIFLYPNGLEEGLKINYHL